MDRVFTPAERRLIRNSDDPDRMLWSLWAGKEAGYKAVQRWLPAVSSAPGRYEVQPSPTGDSFPGLGTVHTPGGPVFIHFSVTDDYVHCIGTTAGAEMGVVVWDIQEMTLVHCSSNESDFVRTMAKKSISVFLDERPETVDIIRPEGDHGLAPPIVKIRDTFPPVSLSMSHDGRFAACAFSIYDNHTQSTPP
jgi:phosphopantetheinyl transferase (holo-ACP synthase)